MEHAKRKCEIERLWSERKFLDSVGVKADVIGRLEVFPRDRQGIGAHVQQMQVSDTRREHHGPTPGAASDIDADAAIRRQQVPRKNSEIVFEDQFALLTREIFFALAECRPFFAESAGNVGIDISFLIDM